MLNGSNAAMIQDHLNLLQDPEQVACVLPTVPLEDLDTQPDPAVNGICGLDLSSFNPMVLTQFDANGRTLSNAHFIAALAQDNSSKILIRKMRNQAEYRHILWEASEDLDLAELLGEEEGIEATAEFIQTSGAFSKTGKNRKEMEEPRKEEEERAQMETEGEEDDDDDRIAAEASDSDD
ncbi:hypothetical protein GYMLUDRAFT_243044 [Collybiopsis luxurians FD-317 M1]|uniref:Uncharacterized protein n=1 Tax=Collybiopsis luxurians FD-317 M1 TaxID=944289 RepID=A0A0D0CRL5_9AGAR|nr:hypothetical protein GYMLUDRAFT_243044 [Collybiopsis luxurians FD-317 M1]